jgi:hypothetical protein
MNNDSKYENLQPIPGEAKYKEFDKEYEHFGIFGETSGFCYASFIDESEADDYLKNGNKFQS